MDSYRIELKVEIHEKNTDEFVFTHSSGSWVAAATKRFLKIDNPNLSKL